MAPPEHRDQHPGDRDRVGDDQQGDPTVLNGGGYGTRSHMAVSRRATPTGGERDEDQEADDQKRECSGPDRPTRRLLALRFHGCRKPTEAVRRAQDSGGQRTVGTTSGVAADEHDSANGDRRRPVAAEEREPLPGREMTS